MDNNYGININIRAASNFGQISKKLDAKLNKLDRSIKKTTNTTKRHTAAFRSMETSMNRLAFVAFPALGLAMRSVWKEGNKYEVATKDLSALTGIQGERLGELTKKADKLSVTWGLAADNIVSGMKRIASNKSEFIEIEGAIEDVAEKASVLARASGLTFYKTGEVITQTMNQFKMGLKDSDRIINAFAAGAKLGSFEIDRLAQVFSRAGGAMKSIGLDFEEAMSVAMIGSRLGLTGEMVGTQLKTGLLRLAQKDDIFNPLIHGFDKSLEALVKAKLTPAELMAIFGLESFQVMQAVTQNQELFKRWKKGITGTNLAYAQAATNMKALAKRVTILTAKFRLIQRSWFFSSKTQSTMNNVMDKIEKFLDQSTWQAVMMKNTFLGLGKAMGVAFAIWGTGKLVKGFLVLKSIAKFLIGKKTWMGIIKAMKSMKILGAGRGFTVAFARLFIIVSSVLSIVKGIGSSLSLLAPELKTRFLNEDWEGVGISIAKAIGFGVWKGFIELGRVISVAVPWLAEGLGNLLGIDTSEFAVGDTINQGFDWLASRVDSIQQEGINQRRLNTENKAAFLRKYIEANPGVAKQEESGEVTLKVVDGTGGAYKVQVIESKGVKTDLGNTGVGASTPVPAYAVPAF